TNEAVKTAHGVSAANFKNNASTLPNVDSISDVVIYSFFASQSNSSQLDNEDLKQIDPDDLEEMDLKWQMAVLTMRAGRFLKKTGRNLGVNRTDTIFFDKTKVKCNNCHIRGHFAGECRAPKNQDSRNIETTRRTVPVEETTSNALVSQCDGFGSSSSDTEISTCSKACLKSYETLKEHYDNLTKDFNKSHLNVGAYKVGLKSVKARLDVYKKNEVVFEEDINILKLDIMLRDNALTELRKKFEKAKKERDDLKLTLEKFENSSKNLSKLLDSQVSDKFKTGVGYDSQVFDSQVFDSQINDKYKSGEGCHVVPPPYTGNFMPPKSDLVLAYEDEYVFSKSVTSMPAIVTSKVKTSESKPKSVSEPLIEDWISDSENENEIEFKESVKKGNPQQDLKDKGVIDSGCSRHMTGNKSYLTDYEEIDGGFVAFGGNFKGGKITRKGKIRTYKLDFEDVYFVKELKFNLFSVSQMCDKKNSVLFTDTKRVVLSPDFKLTDESHVLLKVPKKDNMYSVDLKNVVPQGGLTCLFAKATSDESNLWHMRLGHVNFKTMNTLVKGNLVRGLPSKLFEINQTCVTCQKGKQHRASCKTKIVSSISQPLQMLHMDLFCPTFVKSLMKKMYCLVVTYDFSRFSWVFFLATKDETSEILKTFITGIENLIDLRVKVIRCDNGTEFKNRVLNQFCEMKGYSTNSKSFRVFNIRTRIVEENLHVQFSKTTLNIAGSGPNWLFNIDALTKSMNYKPVVARNQSNGNAGTKACDDAGEEEKNDAEDLENKDSEIPSTEEPRVNQEKDANINSTNNINIVSPTVNVVGIEDNVVDENIVYGYADDPNMPNLEEIVYSDDDEDNDAETDMNNLNTFMPVSPIPTIRLYKDHPLE
ncbi:putative ribonuclease H-like domain-containing protein, partial [Tanacetum coccineum]